MTRALAVVALALACVPALADGFMATHMDNQKVGSPVAAYWRTQAAGTQPEDFMSIHMNNQKTRSPVAAFWRAYAAGGITAAPRVPSEQATSEFEQTAHE